MIRKTTHTTTSLISRLTSKYGYVTRTDSSHLSLHSDVVAVVAVIVDWGGGKSGTSCQQLATSAAEKNRKVEFKKRYKNLVVCAYSCVYSDLLRPQSMCSENSDMTKFRSRIDRQPVTP